MRPKLWLHRLLFWLHSKLSILIERISPTQEKLSSEKGAPAHWLAATSGVNQSQWIESSPVQRPSGKPPMHWLRHIAQANRHKVTGESVDLNDKPNDNPTIQRLSPGPDVEITVQTGPIRSAMFSPGHWPIGVVDQQSEGIKTPNHAPVSNELPPRLHIKLPIRPGPFVSNRSRVKAQETEGAKASRTRSEISETHNSNDQHVGRNPYGRKADQMVDRLSAPKQKVTLTLASVQNIRRNMRQVDYQPSFATTEAGWPGRVIEEPVKIAQTEFLRPANTNRPGKSPEARFPLDREADAYEFQTRTQTTEVSWPDVSAPFRHSSEDRRLDYPTTARLQDARIEDYWPSLPELTLTAKSETSTKALSEHVRRQRIDLEQEGALWNV